MHGQETGAFIPAWKLSLADELISRRNAQKSKNPRNKRRAQYLSRRRKERREKEHELIAKRESQRRKEQMELRIEINRKRNADLFELIDSELFRSRYEDMAGSPWDSNDELYSPKEFRDHVKFLIECLKLKRKYGKRFSFAHACAMKAFGIPLSEEIQMFDANPFFALDELAGLDSMQRRRIMQSYATPEWRDKEAISSIYAERDRLNQEAGCVKFHVDHIIPIQGEIVCGLHVHENLEVVPADENIKKGNRYIVMEF